MNNGHNIFALAVVVFVCVGCDNDTIGPPADWKLDAGLDGSPTEVGGPDTLPDGGADTDPDGDMNSDADGGLIRDADGGDEDGGDTDPAVPPQPRSNTICNDNQWCWIHPAPFPHEVDNLRSVGGEVYATARDGAVRGWQPLVWNESGFELLDKPVAPNEQIVDMTTTRDGWLALKPDGTIYDIGPDGVRDSETLEGDTYEGILGVSFEAYLAWESNGDAILRRDGQSLAYSELPSVPATTAMWEDGTLAGLGELRDQKRGFLNGDWTAYPEPGGFFDEALPALGPSPDSECGSAGLWAAWESGSVARWDDFGGEWENIVHPGGQMQSLGCDAAGGLAAVDDEGALLRWEDGGWNSQNVSRLRLNDFATAGQQTYVGGTYGTLAVASGGTIDRAGAGFRIPPSESPSYYGTGYQDIWVSPDGQTLVLAHGSGLYMGTEQGWSKMPAPGGLESDLRSSERIEIWGINGRIYAIVSSKFLRWDGSRWRPVQRGAGELSLVSAGQDLSGTLDERAWLVTNTNLYLKEPAAEWRSATPTGSSIDQRIESENLTLTAIAFDLDTSPIVAASGALYDLVDQPGGWRLSKRATTPCQTIEDVRISINSTYVVGLEGCVARNDGDGWTEYQLPDASQWPPTVFEARAYEIVTTPAGRPPLVATSVGLLGLREDGTTDIQFIGDFRDAVSGVSNAGTLALHRSGVVARYND